MLSKDKPPKARPGYRWEWRDGCNCGKCYWGEDCQGITWPHWIEIRDENATKDSSAVIALYCQNILPEMKMRPRIHETPKCDRALQLHERGVDHAAIAVRLGIRQSHVHAFIKPGWSGGSERHLTNV